MLDPQIQDKILQATRRDEHFCDLADRLDQGTTSPLNVFGLADLAKPLLALTLQADQVERNRQKPRLVSAKPAQQLGPDQSSVAPQTMASAKPARQTTHEQPAVAPQPILYIVPDVLRARAVATDLAALRGKATPVLHAKPSDLVASGSKSRKEDIERLSVLSAFLQGQEDLLLISGPFLADKLPPLASLQKRALRLELGQAYDYEDLAESLVDLGYVRARAVDSPGQFALRGEIIDLGLYAQHLQDAHLLTGSLPHGTDGLGIRLNFFDRELEAIKIFDLGDQRSLDNLDEISLPPMEDYGLTPETRAQLAQEMRDLRDEALKDLIRQGVDHEGQERFRKWTEQDAEAMENGLNFAGMGRWDFLLNPQASSILDYAAAVQARIILEEPKLLRARLDAAEAEFQEEVKALLLKQNILPQVIEDHWGPAELFRRLDHYPGQKLAFSDLASSGNGLPGGDKIQMQTMPADNYQGRADMLFRDLKAWQKSGREVILALGGERQRKRLRELLLDESLTLPIHPLDLSQGLVVPQADLVLLGAQNLLGRKKSGKKKTKRAGQAIDFFSDLQVGEFVVHDVHGIGQYLGLKTLNSGGSDRDYLYIAYAGDDRLYVPVDQLEEVQRYIGSESAPPKLSKLGSKEWENKKARVKESVRKLAIDLVKVYREREARQGFAFPADTVWQAEFEDNFPYVETEDQLTAMAEIKADMESTKIMDRLLCGDVGFGKTELAFRAIFKAVMSGKQAAMIVPTTVLAQQHYQGFVDRIGDIPIKVRPMSRFVSDADRKQTIKDLANGLVDVVIGTHAVLNKHLKFANLGLLVVDEEQRFGVEQKETLKDRYPEVDVLTLSATPIPRTLHMAVSGVRDISLLSEGPEDRRPVQTYVMEYDPPVIDDAILREISRGGQVFYVYNNIKKLGPKQLELEERLPGARIRRAHGRMSDRQIEDTIQDFLKQEFDILLCTTIIESGIDMSNVNTLIVERAERMGLAQLYQLRGRVGRSERQAYAYITYPPDQVLKEDASKRLSAIRDFTELGSGLKIAMRDLEVRGAGNFLGGEQSGHMGSVGYDLYCRILDETIKEVQGQTKPAPAPDCVINLDIDAHIPASYIADEGQRMDIYRFILTIQTAEDWYDVIDEIIDRFGDPPRPVVNLVDISFVRVQAAAMGITEITREGKHLILRLAEDQKAGDQLFSLFQKDAFAGRLHFNAGHRAYILLRDGALKPDYMAETLRKLWL